MKHFTFTSLFRKHPKPDTATTKAKSAAPAPPKPATNPPEPEPRPFKMGSYMQSKRESSTYPTAVGSTFESDIQIII
ncbi:hypothetical protein HDU98_007008 [Podochytrium sp. JEL0797]|nr:hypothetical protein HDU98_007008 [Podochytrium sp. JEL0797]